MNKIMFNVFFGLTDAVLQGRKTMTRRICKEYATHLPIISRDVESFLFYPDENIVEFLMKDGTIKVSVPPYKNNEVVAVAQSYKDLGYTKQWVEQHISPNPNAKPTDPFEKKYPGWNNKMFTHSELSKNHLIQIQNIKIERLQDVSAEDCLREGIYKEENVPVIGYPIGIPFPYTFYGAVNDHKKQLHWTFAKEAFAVLIDKVSGKGTWEINPYVFAYTFKLIK